LFAKCAHHHEFCITWVRVGINFADALKRIAEVALFCPNRERRDHHVQCAAVTVAISTTTGLLVAAFAAFAAFAFAAFATPFATFADAFA
jgi:hypothetical protein